MAYFGNILSVILQGKCHKSNSYNSGVFSHHHPEKISLPSSGESCYFLLWKLYRDVLISPSVINHGEGSGNPLQNSCLENPMDGGAWLAAVHGVSKSWTRLSDFTFTFHFPALEKEMATHSSILAWRIPGIGEPGGLPSMGLHRVRHNWSDLAAAATVINQIGKIVC